MFFFYSIVCAEVRGSNPPGLFCSAADAHLFTAQSPYRDHHQGTATLHSPPLRVAQTTVVRPPLVSAPANFLAAILPRVAHHTTHFFGW